MVKNLQANSLIERLHGHLEDQLIVSFAGENWYGHHDVIIQACAFSVWARMLSNFPYTSSQLVFGRAMIFGQKITVDWEQVKQLCHEQAAQNNEKENHHHIEQD